MRVTRSVAEMFVSATVLVLCGEMPILIDAVCINQGDDVEKAHQVQKMSSIYSLAEEVIVWLGLASDGSDLAEEQIIDWSKNDLFTSTDSANKLLSIPNGLNKARLRDEKDTIWDAPGALFCRSWFARLWVFQEIDLARKCRLVCGTKLITLEQMVNVAKAMPRLGLHMFLLKFPDKCRGTRALNALCQMGEMKQVEDGHGGSTLQALIPQKEMIISLPTLMEIAQDKLVSDPRDRVYGILGLAAPEIHRKIDIDYSVEGPDRWIKAYKDFAKAYIQEPDELKLLYMLSGRPTDPALPSWCPNFNVEQERQLRIGRHLKAGVIESQKHKREIPKTWVESDKDTLFAPGYRIDVVRKVVSTKFSWYFPGKLPFWLGKNFENANIG